MTYLAMTINFGLNLLGDDEFSYLLLNTLNCEIKSFSNFSHVNDLIRCHILDERFFANIFQDARKSATEVQVESHLRGDLGNLPLEVHVSTIQEVFNNVPDTVCTFTCSLHEVLEA